MPARKKTQVAHWQTCHIIPLFALATQFYATHFMLFFKKKDSSSSQRKKSLQWIFNAIFMYTFICIFRFITLIRSEFLSCLCIVLTLFVALLAFHIIQWLCEKQRARKCVLVRERGLHHCLKFWLRFPNVSILIKHLIHSFSPCFASLLLFLYLWITSVYIGKQARELKIK